MSEPPSDAERDLIRGLAEFAEALEAGAPVEAAEVRREDTPDGPLHTRRRVVLRPKPKPKE